VGGFLAGMALITIFRLGARKREVRDPESPVLSLEEIAAVTDRARRPIAAEVEIPTIFLHADGVQSGPFTLDQIQLRLARQELGADARYWSEGMSQWESVQDLADRTLP
jgi:hypothetical protein